MKFLRNAAVVAAMGVAMTAAPAPAMAADPSHLIVSCSAGSRTAEVKVRYRTLGNYHRFDQVSWRISGTAGGQNVVRLYFHQDRQDGDVVFQARSFQGGKTATRNLSVSRPAPHRVYVRVAVKFDTTAAGDPICRRNSRGI